MTNELDELILANKAAESVTLDWDTLEITSSEIISFAQFVNQNKTITSITVTVEKLTLRIFSSSFSDNVNNFFKHALADNKYVKKITLKIAHYFENISSNFSQTLNLLPHKIDLKLESFPGSFYSKPNLRKIIETGKIRSLDCSSYQGIVLDDLTELKTALIEKNLVLEEFRLSNCTRLFFPGGGVDVRKILVELIEQNRLVKLDISRNRIINSEQQLIIWAAKKSSKLKSLNMLKTGEVSENLADNIIHNIKNNFLKLTELFFDLKDDERETKPATFYTQKYIPSIEDAVLKNRYLLNFSFLRAKDNFDRALLKKKLTKLANNISDPNKLSHKNLMWLEENYDALMQHKDFEYNGKKITDLVNDALNCFRSDILRYSGVTKTLPFFNKDSSYELSKYITPKDIKWTKFVSNQNKDVGINRD